MPPIPLPSFYASYGHWLSLSYDGRPPEELIIECQRLDYERAQADREAAVKPAPYVDPRQMEFGL